jgi:regulator of sigma E protease
VAKLNGVKVLEFNVGFGAPIVQVTRGETTYGLRSIPLGGYVRLAGMDDGDSSPRSFNNKPVWRRVLIIAAGATTNLVIPIFIFFALQAAISGGPVTVAAVVPGSAAEQNGIKAGDQVLKIDGANIDTVTRLRNTVNASQGRPVEVTFRHSGGVVVGAHFEPRRSGERWVIGVAAEGGDFDPVAAVRGAVAQDWAMITGTFMGFGTLIAGHIPGGLAGPCGPSGPVGIVRATAEAANSGILSLAEWAAFLSVNLGILNLMPLPALDGGRLAFLVVEGIRRRPVNAASEQKVHYIGLAILLGLILLISFNDILRFGTPFATLVNKCQG